MNYPESYERSRRIGTYILSPLHKAYRQAMLYLEGGDCDAAVGSSEVHIIAYIKRFGPCPMGELSRVFGFKKSTVTGMLDRLTEKGYISREVNPEDRRSFVLEILPEGEAVAKAAGALVARFEGEVLARVSEADLQGFRNVLDAVAGVTQVDVRGKRREAEKESL